MAHEQRLNDESGWYSSLSPSQLLRHNREELFYIAAEPLRAPAMAARRLALRLRREKPVAYIGWIGHRNLGDEIMFKVIRRALSPLPVTPFTAPVGEAVFDRLGLGGPGFFRAVLLGGGTLINPLFLRAARLVNTFGTPFHTVGTGVGSPGFGMPLHTTLEGWREALNDSLVSVRGPLSQQSLQDVGLRHAVVIGDPALGLAPDSAPAFRVRKRLVINLAKEPGTRPSPAESVVYRCASSIAKQFLGKGGEVVGIVLGNGDRSTLARFRAEHGIPGMTIEDHRMSGEGLLRTLAGSIGLIGVRLHSAVMASCVGVPSILMAYRNKCDDFMASMDLNDFAIPLAPDKSAELMTQRWDQIVSQPEMGRRIHEKALFWKEKQRLYYRELAARFDPAA